MHPVSRIAVVLSHPIQYYSPWFRWMSERGWTLRVFYLWDASTTRQIDREFGRPVIWDVDLLSGYEHEFVPNRAKDPGTHHLSGLDNPHLGKRLKNWKPDAVLLFGYKYLTHLRLIASAPCPLIFRGDSHLLDPPAPSLLKRWMLQWIYSRFAAITYTGDANLAYFRAFNVPPGRLFHAPHCVDADHFVSNEKLQATAEALKRRLGLADRQVVLFAGKLISKKQPKELLEAFHAVDIPNAALVFVGDGAELESLRTRSAQRPDKIVRFLPFANQSEMPACYLMADIFSLPSGGPGETWGLAVNEAMHMGVPCLVSDRVGCQRDLVTEGETGWVFTATSAAELQAALTRAFDAIRADATGLKQRVNDRIKNYTYAQASAGLAQAVRYAVGGTEESV